MYYKVVIQIFQTVKWTFEISLVFVANQKAILLDFIYVIGIFVM